MPRGRASGGARARARGTRDRPSPARRQRRGRGAAAQRALSRPGEPGWARATHAGHIPVTRRSPRPRAPRRASAPVGKPSAASRTRGEAAQADGARTGPSERVRRKRKRRLLRRRSCSHRTGSNKTSSLMRERGNTTQFCKTRKLYGKTTNFHRRKYLTLSR